LKGVDDSNMPGDTQEVSQIEIEILANTPDSGEIILMECDQTGKFLLLGGRAFPDPNNYDPVLAARYLEALESLQRRGLVRHDQDRLYLLRATGFEARKRLLEKGATP
jgi:hypothetical protein